MSIEDAIVLARELAAAESVPAALSRYEHARHERTAKMLRMARSNRDSTTPGPVRRRIHDVVMPIAMKHFYEKATGWLYADVLGSPDPVDGSTGHRLG
jgi:salicylate hydroxylase